MLRTDPMKQKDALMWLKGVHQPKELMCNDNLSRDEGLHFGEERRRRKTIRRWDGVK